MWDVPDQRKCINLNAGVWVAAAINIALDLLVVALPVPQVRGLALPNKKKIQVTIMFSIGIL